MEKLELKHIAPYLPYKLIVRQTGQFEQPMADEFIMTVDNIDIVYANHIKPLLRPLSDLTKEIPNDKNHVLLPLETLKRLEKNEFHKCSGAKSFIAACELKKIPFSRDRWIAKKLTNCPYWIIQKLFEWHFDVFGLIPAGLAIKK